MCLLFLLFFPLLSDSIAQIKCDAHINKHSGRSESPHVIISGQLVPCHNTLAVT